MIEFKWGRMIGLQEADLSFSDFSAHIGHAVMRVICE